MVSFVLQVHNKTLNTLSDGKKTKEYLTEHTHACLMFIATGRQQRQPLDPYSRDLENSDREKHILISYAYRMSHLNWQKTVLSYSDQLCLQNEPFELVEDRSVICFPRRMNHKVPGQGKPGQNISKQLTRMGFEKYISQTL